jgi:two-component system, LuxR family, response regulator FixJ
VSPCPELAKSQETTTMQDADNRLIFILDDDPDVLATFQIILRRAGFTVVGFGEGPALLDSVRHATPACILVDVNMPGMSGLTVLKTLVERAYDGPIIMISGAGDIPMAVDAIHAGAWDFLEKPLGGDAIVESLQSSIAGWGNRRKDTTLVQWLRQFPGRTLLTQREIEILDQVIAGATSKEIARTLGISWRTVETHRSRILEKTGTRHFPELMGLILRSQTNPAPLARSKSNNPKAMSA